MKTGHINCFEISHCGLYDYKIDSDLKASSCTEVFETIFSWLENRNFGDTIPWDPERPTKLGNCYKKSHYKDDETGDYFLVLWKQFNSDKNGQLYGVTEVSGTDQSINLKKENKGEKIIWGKPCYYWISPSNNKVFSIKFDDSFCDKDLFCHWVKSVIENKANQYPNRYVSHHEKGNPQIIFKKDGKKLYFRFSIKLFIGSTKLDSLKQRCHEIREVMYRNKIILSEGVDERAWFQKISDFIPFPYLNQVKESKKRTIEITLDATPSKEQMEELIEKHNSEIEENSSETNASIGLGFKLEDGTLIWANEFRLTSSVSSNKNSFLTAKELHEILIGKIEKFQNSFIKKETTNLKTGT